MKKNLLPIILAGAGAVIFFIMKKKKDVSVIEKFDENQEAILDTKPKKKSKPKTQSFDVNKTINKISTLATKGKKIVSKIKKKKKVKPSNTFISPLQPKPKQPTKFF
jgi:hypothetical protein